MIRALLSWFLLQMFAFSPGSWTVGLGGGKVQYMGYSESDSLAAGEISAADDAWRAEIEAGYYFDNLIDVLVVYGENLSLSPTGQSLYRDQHLGLLGEYRLFALGDTGYLQGAVGAGPSLHRFKYCTEGEHQSRSPVFTLDTQLAALWFASPHLLLRAQLTYSFPPLYPKLGAAGLTLRAVGRF